MSNKTIFKSAYEKLSKIKMHHMDAIYEFPKYYREFSFRLAAAQFMDRAAGKYVGYTNRYIRMASKYMIHELQPVVQQYKGKTTVEQQKAAYDFGDKIPVWVCWWQGYDNMPECTRICFDRLKNNFKEPFEVVLVTMENYQIYINIPDYIFQKQKEGKMSFTHMADVLRWGLMASYGGVWIDACMYTSDTAYENFKRYITFDYFTQHFEKPSDCPHEPCRGKWSTGIFMGKHSPEIRIFQFVYDSLLYYWQHHDFAFHYVFLDYILWTAYCELPDVRQRIDAVETNNTDFMYGIARIANEAFNQDKWQYLMNHGDLYRLSYKDRFVDVDKDGNKTFYGHLKLCHDNE